jgi:PAS domain S-box-containing protein
MVRPRHDRFAVAAALGLVGLIALCAFAAVAYRGAIRWVDHTLEVRRAAEEWTVALLVADLRAQDCVTSSKSTLYESYGDAIRLEREKGERLRQLVGDNVIELEAVDALDRDALAATESFADLVRLVRDGQRGDALALLAAGESERRMDRFAMDEQRVGQEEERLLVAGDRTSNELALLTFGGGTLLALAAVALLTSSWTIQRRRVELSDRLTLEARVQLEALSDVASALSEARSRSQVANVVVEQGMRATGADTCMLYMLDQSAVALELIGERGTAPEIVEKIRRITATTGSPQAFAVLTSGRALWIENESEYVAAFPSIAATETQGPRAKAFWTMPLVVEGRPVGLLGMGFYGARSFSPEERRFTETFTKQCAQALVRAAHLEREDQARTWFATTLRSIGDAVIATDAEGRLTFMNPVAEQLTGWTDAETRGRPLDEVFSIFSEQTRKSVESPVTRVLREGAIVGLGNHTVLRPKRGPEIPIHDSAAPIRDADGRLFGVVLVFRDAAREKREQAQREFLARAGEALVSSLDYRAVLGTVAHFAVPELADWCVIDIQEPGAAGPHQVAVAHVDPGKVAFARELGERYPPPPDATTGAPQVIRTGKSELYTEISAAMLEEWAKDAEQLRMLLDLRLESAMVVPLRGRHGTVGAMTFVYAESGRRYTAADLAFAEDFARRASMAIENAATMKEVEDARTRERALRREAEVASRAKDDFLATVSHELRTPLNAILGWTLTLRGRKPDPEIDRPLAVIERNARAQTKLIEDVLDVSRIISGKLALNLGPTNVADAIAAAIDTVTPAADAKGVRISSDVEAHSLTMTADAERLQQVVWNLLTNAVKFTPKGGAVAVRGYREGAEICVHVTDTGEGIRPEVLPLVFEPFQQADASTTRRHGGLGLGLAIVKQLVTAHGGTVTVSSDGPGKGATFVIRLPARSATPAVRTSSVLTSGERERPLPRLDGLRLLVVDDEDDARVLVGAVLGEQGAEVHLVASASEALEQISIIRPDVVVSDIAMPQMDGYALIRKIRALPPSMGGRTPAVALTAHARSEDAKLAFAAGFQMHVAKPIEPVELAIVVANLGGRSMDPP